VNYLGKKELYLDALINHFVGEGYSEFEAKVLAEKMFRTRI